MAGIAAEKGDVEPIVVNTGVTGQTVTIRVVRASDGFLLDWSDNTFKVPASVVTPDQALAEISALYVPGHYELNTVPHVGGLHTGLLVNLSATNLEQLLVVPTAPGVRVASGLLKIVPLIDGVTPERTVTSRTNAMARGRIVLTGAVPKPAQDAIYYDESGAPVFTNRNTGDERNPVP